MSKQDYVDLFKKYDLYRSDIYLLCEDRTADIYALFDEVCDELIKDRAINRQLPQEFVHSANLFELQDTYTHLHFSQISNRAFFLSDLIDFLALIRARKS